jgi:hypothetical protein
MPRLTLAALFVLAFAAGGFTQEKKEEKKPTNLLPLAKGTKWELAVSAGGMEVDAVLEVTEVNEPEKGKPARAVMFTTVGGQKADSATYSADEKGVYQHTLGATKLETPTVAIHYPVKPGNKWSHKVDLGGTPGTLELEQLEPEEVKVPSGKYTAYPVKMLIKADGKTVVTSTSWYAEGVGAVKNETVANGLTIKMELKKFTAGK